MDYVNNISAKNPPRLFGGWSQYLQAVTGGFMVKVADGLPSEMASLVEIMAVTVGSPEASLRFFRGSFRFDDTGVVLVVGRLGMCHVMKARMLGARTITGADLSDFRLGFAAKQGVDRVISPRKSRPRIACLSFET